MRWGLMVIGIIGFILLPTPVAGHGNYVAADHQVTDDGTIRIELVVAVTDAFIVLHADGGGEPRQVIGHQPVGDGFVHPDVEVQIDDSYWHGLSGNTTIWAVLHRNTGSSTFDSNEDPALETAEGELVGTQFKVRRSSAGKFNIQGEQDHGQETDTHRLTVRRVELAGPGFLTVQEDNDGSPGQIIGHTALSEGVHRDVVVAFDETYYQRQPERFTLWVTVHDGNNGDQFDPTIHHPVRVDGSPVATQLTLVRTDDIQPDNPPQSTPTNNDQSLQSPDAQGTETTVQPKTATPANGVTPSPQATETPGQHGVGLVSGGIALLLSFLFANRYFRR